MFACVFSYRLSHTGKGQEIELTTQIKTTDLTEAYANGDTEIEVVSMVENLIKQNTPKNETIETPKSAGIGYYQSKPALQIPLSQPIALGAGVDDFLFSPTTVMFFISVFGCIFLLLKSL